MKFSFPATKTPLRARPRTAARALTALLVFALVNHAVATNHILRQDQLMVGFNGDATVQYLVITVGGNDQKAWAAQGGETSSRAMLVFFNSNGVQTGTFFFPNNPPQGGNSVLIATASFASLPGAPVPDIIVPPMMSPGNGKVTFRGNPANPARFDVNLSLSYGNFPPSLTDGAGPPAPALPISGDATSLARFQNFAFGGGTSQNGDFALRPAVPVNTRGQSFTFPVDGPEIDAAPSAIDFGGQNVAVGATAARNITITSRGTLNPLIINNIFLAGAQSNQFNLLAGGGGPVTLPPGGTRTVTVNFDPSSVGSKVASLRVTSNDTNEPVTDVALTGFGIDPNAPDILVTPTNINFGIRDIALGAGASIGEIVANVGNIGTLTISSLSLAGANTNQFRIVADTGQSSLGPGASRALSFVFTPSSAGSKSAALRIVSNDPDESIVQVPITGFAFDLNPCTAPNPTNSVPQDVSTNAMLVCPGLEFSGVMPPTQPDGQSSCPSAGADLWFRYVAASSGPLTVNLEGIAMVPVLSAHSGVPGTVANQLACQSVAGSNSAIAQLTLSAIGGEAIFLRVASAVAAPGSQFRLALAGPPCFEFDKNRNGTTDTCESDFGSAPAPFPTLLVANGARHRAFTGVFLGTRVDANDDGMPSVGATGDKLDGPENDEDGVLFTSALIVGQTASVAVTASTNGLLNTWIDFNVDGDWADPGEQIFTNRALSAGLNALSIAVPGNALATNRTYARFRFSSTGNLGVQGPATDGEVEDYAVEILPVTVTPGALQARFSEVMAGLNGDSTVQFVELEVNSDADKLWGPQSGETAGRAMLAFFDEAGAQSGRFVFPSNAPAGGTTVLVATRAFAEKTGLRPDFFMPPELSAIGGRVAFMANPDNLRFSMNIALSYGGIRYFGQTGGAGPANTNETPILGAKSLTRTAPVPFGVNQNSAFVLIAPTPRNTANQTVALTEALRTDQGKTLFTRETFRGNGRTCATCHIDSARDQFGLTAATILELPEEDPLFVFEENVNVMKLVIRSQPSDLRGPLTGTLGNGRVLAGSGDSFLVIGGTNLAGIVTDTNGNTGILQTVTPGNLSGPTPGNGSPRGLEDHSLLEHGRGLILENIDGFQRREVFRTSPHLLNIVMTAPYGLSGEFSNLEDFSVGAVIQHFPRTLGRVSGLDFRQPTREEMVVMTEFMNSIFQPSDADYDLDRFATTEAQKRGRTLFFNSEGKCSQCHSGPLLNASDGTLFNSINNENENFNTGVANLLRNIADGLPTEPAGLTPGQSTRNFNTPSLIGVRLTAPFFHDGSVPNLKEAVEFYDTEQFVQSPAGQLTGTILAANREDKVADLVAFLESLVELPVGFTRDLSFGVRCPGSPVLGPLTATITNHGAVAITITNVAFNGTNAGDFNIVADTGQTTLAPGQTRTVTVAFNATATGGRRATLEFVAVETNLIGRFEFGVALSGAEVDNNVTASPASFAFGTRDIDAPPSPEVSLVITNDGSSPLDLSGFAVTGATPQDFVVTADTSPLAPHDVRVIQVSFKPRSQGAKSASIHIPVLACNTSSIDIPLTGAASSTVHHFTWDPLGATQYVGTAFAVRVTAQDRNNDTVAAFGGTVRLVSLIDEQMNSVLIAPTNSGPFMNGVWNGSITVLQPAASVRLQARDNQGHTGMSGVFIAPLRDDVSLVSVDSPDPVSGGGAVTYRFTVHNTGPTEATGVTLSDTLPAGVRFASGNASQGQVAHAGGVVTWQLGSLSRGISATGLVMVLPEPGFATVTNLAVVTRNELEANLGNNLATNVTSIQPFGLLTVTPESNFTSSGLSGGPFTPTNHVFFLSNAGTATLNWQVKGAGCALPPGIRGWWPLDGSAADAVGTNGGTLVAGPQFTNGLVGMALDFDGVDDVVRIPASPSINLEGGSGLTMEAWINPTDVSVQRPVLEYTTDTQIGAHLWISVPAIVSGPGSVFGQLIDTNNVQHHLVSVPGLVVGNAWQHVAMTYSKSSGVATLYLNGVVVAQQNLGVFTPRTSLDLLIGQRTTPVITFAGRIDEPAVYDRELAAAEIQAIVTAGAGGKCASPTAPAGTLNCNQPSGIVAWWPLDGSLVDQVSTNVGVLVGNPTFTNGLVSGALLFDGIDDGLRVPVSPELDFGTNDAFSFETWFNVPDASRRNSLFEYFDGSSFSGPHLFIGNDGAAAQLFGGLVQVGNIDHPFRSPGGLFVPNVWNHAALTYNRPNGVLKLYMNGTLVHQQNIGTFILRTTGSVFLGRRPALGLEESMQGRLDEPAFYGRELSAVEIQAIFAAGATGKCQRPTGTSNCSPPSGMTGWWPLDGSAGDRQGTNNGQLIGNPAFLPGLVGQALSFDGVDDEVDISASSSLDIGNGPGMTIELWIQPMDLIAQQPLVEWNNGMHFWLSQAAPLGNGPGCLFANIIDTTGTAHHIASAGGLVSIGQWQHVALTYDKASAQAVIFINGLVVTQRVVGTFSAQTAPPSDLLLGRRFGSQFRYSGAMDEVSIYGRALAESEIRSIFLAGPAGKCRNQSWFSQSQSSGTLAPGQKTNLVVSINTNASALPVGSYSATLQFTNASNGRDSTDRSLALHVINRAPTLNALLPLVIAEDAGPSTVLLGGITAGGLEIQRLAVSASSDNASLIASPITANYTSPASTGTVMFALVPNAHGTAVVSVIVRDDAGTANGALDAVTNSFRVTVIPVGDSPTLAPISNQTIGEGTALLITNVLFDPDLPNDQHLFSLIAPPPGASIAPNNGVFTWQPGEDQGPSTNQITVVVRDNGSPQLSATNRFAVVVLEINSPPVLTVPVSRTVLPGVPVSFNVSAADSDLPANRLAFSLGPGAPPGASLNATNGVFSWTPPLAPVPGTNVFTFVVTDNGAPALSDQEAVTLLVTSQPVIESITSSGATVTIRWSALPGLNYRVQFKTSLGEALWGNLPGDVIANGPSAMKTDSTASSGQLFYRVIVLP